MHKYLVILFLLHITFVLKGQAPFNNIRYKKIFPTGAPIVIDTNTVLPNSLQVLNADSTEYSFNYNNNRFIWKGALVSDSIMVSYRVFPFNLYAKKQLNSYDSVLQKFKLNTAANTAEAAPLFDWGNIDYTGTLGRGLSFGNSQSAVLNSNLNLTLSGYLADSIEMSAQINDNNLPIQPEGTTQQLNEFDRILLTFKKKDWQVMAGDIDLRENESYFLRFNKRVQGLGVQYKSNIAKHVTNNISASGSVTKGRYHRFALQPLEGNQGPYRLQGANNEVFFIVIANSERIYFNGELLLRGYNNDYTIDYNTAEIVFTGKRMITKDVRIQVEFEYADRNYVNSLFYINDEVRIGSKFNTKIQYYTNTDAKNSTVNISLDETQKAFLFNVGDSTQSAFYPISAKDTLTGNKILYAKRDTIVNGIHDSIYVFSTNPIDAKFSLTFIDVGQGNGNYNASFSGINGRTFAWIAPQNGLKQGRYEPALFLITPKKLEIITVQTTYQIHKNSKIDAQFATSKNDVNLFASKDKANDRDIATKIVFDQLFPFYTKQKLALAWRTEAEYVGKWFTNIERLRNIEFIRDWSLPQLLPRNNEKMLSTTFSLQNQLQNSAAITVTKYTRDKDYEGLRLITKNNMVQKMYSLSHQLSYTTFTGYGSKGYFFRPIINAQKRFNNKWFNQLTTSYLLERNEVRNINVNSLATQSFSFQEYRFDVASDVTKANKYTLGYFYRSDYYPFTGKLEKGDRSHNITGSIELARSTNRQLQVNTTYRLLKVFKPNMLNPNLKNENSLLNTIRYQFKEFKELVNGAMFYENGAGQEQRRDFTYIEVPLGQGNYYWVDYNNDGLKQLNEFEPAIYPDQKQYIRLFTATNQYVKAAINAVGYNINIVGSRLKYTKSQKFLAFASKFYITSTMAVSKKAISGDNAIILNPLLKATPDSSLINFSLQENHGISYNKTSMVWGADIGYSNNKTRNLLAYGYETNTIKAHVLKLRYQISKSILLKFSVREFKQALLTPAFGNRNYKLNGYGIQPEINYTYKTALNIGASVKLEDKKNSVLFGGETMTGLSVGVDVKYSFKNSGFLTSKFTLSNYNYKGIFGSTTSFVMLEALQPGQNYLWTFEYNKRLRNGLELQIGYDGRKAGNSKFVHTGRSGIVAAF